jgi:hypothetical protein
MPDEQSMQPMQTTRPAEPMRAMEPMHAMNGHEAVGHLYMQTNELRNAIRRAFAGEPSAVSDRVCGKPYRHEWPADVPSRSFPNTSGGSHA